MAARPTARALDREIFALALPAFATLVSEPLLLLADSAFIGHLGTSQLAGLGVSTNVLGIIFGLCIFLAYGTTSTVARRLGAGNRAAALAGGFNGLVLAGILGVLLCVLLQILIPVIVAAYGVAPEVAVAATTYLRIAALGIPSVLILLASTGVLRGLQDTRTPLYVAIGTNLVNIGLNFALVYGLDLGIRGAAIGTLIAQTAAAVFLARVVIIGARRAEARLSFHPAGVLSAARSGVWLVARTATLQVAITLTTLVAATGGAVVLGAHQVINSLWTLLAFALDAIAIAGQAIVGRYLGAGQLDTGRAITNRMIGWGVVCGVAFGVVIAATSPLYVRLFTPDQDVQNLVRTVLWVVAIVTPIAGVVYVLDGVLIGAGDGRYLALAGLIALLAYVPLALTVRALDAGLVWLWVGYGGFMVARMITLVVRAHGRKWMRVGAEI